ncbi:acetyltransferase [Priestia koreensis]|uniref:Acetyltransferase n=2 Tax=Priestia koreensis TaxID=284581 RepID=A0A0M0L5K6_9BACI|nr:acetyltransferase [Priestia koreensis]
MKKEIIMTAEHPDDFAQLEKLYEDLGWNSLHLTVAELEAMCKQSWYVVYAFDEGVLVGTGRVISDGVITGTICGVGVAPAYQKRGIGQKIMEKIVTYCEQHRVIPQLFCDEKLESYYQKHGFHTFTIGMKKDRSLLGL